MLTSVNEMLKGIQDESYITGIRVEFSSKSCSTAFNGLFTSKGLCSMMEAKNMRCIDYVFPCVACFIDRVCGELWKPITSLSV